ncbi:MAG: hypothetical protein Q7T30_01530 [Planctomycetota bacterium]|nr:hypothetical protein [Planctomycetota bacterium]
MKRPTLLLLLGIVAGLVAFGIASRLQTSQHRRILDQPAAELAWLRHEYQLSDDQFARVSALHTAYQPTCAELCRRIADANQNLRDAVARTNALTDEIRERVRDTGRTRDDCRQAMLAHLYAVAREMPPDAGRRYLDTMLAATCVLQEARPIGTALSEALSEARSGARSGAQSGAKSDPASLRHPHHE